MLPVCVCVRVCVCVCPCEHSTIAQWVLTDTCILLTEPCIYRSIREYSFLEYRGPECECVGGYVRVCVRICAYGSHTCVCAFVRDTCTQPLVCVWVCVRVCVCVCACVHVCVWHAHSVWVGVHVCMRACAQVCTVTCEHVCMHMRAHVYHVRCTCVCVCVRLRFCVCVHAHARVWKRQSTCSLFLRACLCQEVLRGLFRGCTGLFWVYKWLFWVCKGLFWVNIGLFECI